MVEEKMNNNETFRVGMQIRWNAANAIIQWESAIYLIKEHEERRKYFFYSLEPRTSNITILIENTNMHGGLPPSVCTEMFPSIPTNVSSSNLEAKITIYSCRCLWEKLMKIRHSNGHSTRIYSFTVELCNSDFQFIRNVGRPCFVSNIDDHGRAWCLNWTILCSINDGSNRF